MVENGHVYIEISKGVYRLPQAGILANDLLKKRLLPHGYYKCAHTPGLWHHISNSVCFTSRVDDFGVECKMKEDVEHLTGALKPHYEMTNDWKEKHTADLPSGGITLTTPVNYLPPATLKECFSISSTCAQ